MPSRPHPPAAADAASPKPARRAASGPNAITLLRADHRRCADLFAQFDKARSVPRRREIAEQACLLLAVHTLIEEEIFYPAVKDALRDHELVPEAEVEHQTLKSLIAQILDGETSGEQHDARVKVLGEYMRHHVREEHGQLFRKARSAVRLDLRALGQQLQERQQALLAEPEQVMAQAAGAAGAALSAATQDDIADAAHSADAAAAGAPVGSATAGRASAKATPKTSHTDG